MLVSVFRVLSERNAHATTLNLNRRPTGERENWKCIRRKSTVLEANSCLSSLGRLVDIYTGSTRLRLDLHILVTFQPCRKTFNKTTNVHDFKLFINMILSSFQHPERMYIATKLERYDAARFACQQKLMIIANYRHLPIIIGSNHSLTSVT